MSINYPYENDVVVEIAGQQHNHWKSYDIDSDFLIPADAFRFEIMRGFPEHARDFSGARSKSADQWRIGADGRCSFTQHGISKTNRTFSLNGADKASI